MRLVHLALIAALAGCAGVALPALVTDESGDPNAVSARFDAQVSARYPLGGDYAAAKADVEANGFTCRDYPQYVARADIPTHECRKGAMVSHCNREFTIELRESAEKLRSAATGRYDVMCLGAM